MRSRGVWLAAVAAAVIWTGCRIAERPPAAPAVTPARTEAPAPSGCVRGEPQPVLAAVEGKPAPVFVRTAALEARETYIPGDAPAVEIRHFGCAHFGLEFTFTLTAAADRDPDWRRAADLMEGLAATEPLKSTVAGIAKLLRRQSGPLAAERLEKSEMESVTVKMEKGPRSTRLILTYDFVL